LILLVVVGQDIEYSKYFEVSFNQDIEYHSAVATASLLAMPPPSSSSSKPNQFAKFVSTSPLSTQPHDPFVTLASNGIRDFLGPTVQLVADALATRGESTLPQLLQYIPQQYARKKLQSLSPFSQERREMIYALHKKVVKDDACPTPSLIRAALLVLWQHSLVTLRRTLVTPSSSSSARKRKQPTVLHHYMLNLDRARLMSRYPRFLEYIQKQDGTTCALLLEELLLQGKRTAVQVVQAVVQHLEREQKQNEEDNNTASTNLSHKQTLRKQVVESLWKLIQGGYIQPVDTLERTSNDNEDQEDDNDQGEFEFEGQNDGPAQKKQKQITTRDEESSSSSSDEEDAAIVALLQSGPMRGTAVCKRSLWRANVLMLHEQLRALRLGWLVFERYGSRIDKAGSIVTAGLKIVANRRHAKGGGRTTTISNSHDLDVLSQVSVKELYLQLPNTVKQLFDKKPGGGLAHLYQTLMELSRVKTPKVVLEWEVAPDRAAEAKFQINTRALVTYFRDRIVHQVSGSIRQLGV
jgi:hypothetical protein